MTARHLHLLFRLTGAAVLSAALSSCIDFNSFFRKPDMTPVRNALKLVMPIGYAANLTMAAMRGASLPNVTMIRNGNDTSTGCFLLHIVVDSTYPLPGTIRANGIIITAGIIVNNRTAIMSAAFSELNVTQGSFILHDISTFPVAHDTDVHTGKQGVTIVYGDFDINARSDTLLRLGITQGHIDAELIKFESIRFFEDSILFSEAAWIIHVDDNGTIADPADDIYMAGGAGQYLEIGQVVQMNMVASMSPQCKFNPSEGSVFMQCAGEEAGVGHVLLGFDSVCDGTAHVILATGRYIKSIGKDIPLELDK